MATLLDSLDHTPVELNFGTSGLRGLVSDMTDLECYINTRGFIEFLKVNESLPPDAVFYLGGDLRESTPSIVASAYKATQDAGHQTVNLGMLPTPALMHYALSNQSPSIMVTGSHIPADRNGIKFNKPDGEVLKEDEAGIKTAVAAIRQQIYAEESDNSLFDGSGRFKQLPEVPESRPDGISAYLKRYTDIFHPSLFEGKHIVVYQQSSVARDILVDIFEKLGAKVSPVGRSDTFIPIDTENVTPEDQSYFRKLAGEYPDAFAIISTDGDADRPFVIDETGTFHRGDVLGALVGEWIKADFAAIPISSSDAVEHYLTGRSIKMTYTKIGSPYVVAAMNTALADGRQRVTGWEVNGGFLLGSAINVADGRLEALPSRDALLPILGVLAAAIENNSSLSTLFRRLPARFTAAGLIDNFPMAVSKQILEHFSGKSEQNFAELKRFFSADYGFGNITDLNALDGLRIFFDNGDIAHLRPSGNAPQLRLYSVADSQERADEIVRAAIVEPDGIIRALERQFS